MCREPNSAQRRYCSKCGERLWDPCLACGGVNQVHERYCGTCGSDLAALAQERKQQIEETLANAEQLAQSGKYLDAIKRLQAIEATEHSQLRLLLAEVQERLQLYPRLREEALADAGAAEAEARELLAARRVDAAHARLSRIPPALQSMELKRLADELDSLHAEATQLRTSIATAVREKKYAGLLPLAERLLELNGDDAKIMALVDQLRALQAKADKHAATELTKAAQAALDACDYAKALAAVQRIPAGALVGDALAVAKQVRERTWLFDRLRTEPHVSPALLGVAQRLAKLQPQDGRIGKLVEDVSRRWSQHQQGLGTNRPGWARPPETSFLGLPVDLMPLPEQLAASQPKRRERAASLLTAYGLALQAAGRAAHALDLFPEEKSGSWLGRVGAIRPRRASACWGVDVGSSALKAVKLSAQGEQASVQQTLVVPYAAQNAADADVAMLRSKVLAAFLTQHELAGCTIAINLPGTHTLARFFEMPVPRRGKFDDAVKYEVRARLPLDEEQCVYDFAASEPEAQIAGSTTPLRRVMLIAGSREHLHRVAQPWKEANATRILIQSECVALANALIASTKPQVADCAFLELGAQSANLVAFTAAGVWFRGLYAGMSSFDHAIAKRFNITHVEAETLRRRPDRAPFMHEVDELLQNEFAAVAKAVRRGLTQLQHELGVTPARLLLCGGGAYQFGMLRYLRLGG